MITRITRTPILHRIVEHQSTLYLAGLVADDKSASMGGQTTQILTKVKELLESGGSDMTKVLAATIYVTDMDAKAEMNDAWLSFFPPEHLPARATVGVAELGHPQTKIEVVIVAAK